MLLNMKGCSDPSLGYILRILKTFFTIIEVISPIVLIISLIILFTKLLANPEEKKLLDNIRNAIISGIIIFLIPVLVNLTMTILGEKYTFSECWNNAYLAKSGGKYIENKKDKDKTPTKVYTGIDDYHGEVTNPIGNGTVIAELACAVAGTFAPENRITNNTGNVYDHYTRISDPRVQDYQDVMDAIAHTGNGHDNPAYCSCTQGAAAIIRATVDKYFWMIDPIDALDYMEQSPNWKFIGMSDYLGPEKLQPGDVFGRYNHTMIWVSNEVARKYRPWTTGNVYEASYGPFAFPGIDQYSNGNIKGWFKVYRFVGTANPGMNYSKYLKN